MRLLRSTTLEFESFEGGNIPAYAILSHTWGSHEVSHQEMLAGSGGLKAGYDKIKRCGELAMEDGWEYFWVDTCCIDKSSSAELSEAINSMYAWYRNASICYAYLSDVSAASSADPLYPTVSSFRRSRWFTRGWTLQELIAPRDVVFLSKEWKEIGSKETLKERIKEITGIQLKALEGADMGLFSVSERMSWAAKRQTTRIEDVAYSLIGLFGVNMPLLYGEGEKSFTRLQEEIMKNSDDQSLFAWTDTDSRPEVFSGLLARSPKHFANSAHISSFGVFGKSDAFSITNKGLLIELFLVKYAEEQGIYRASLDCYVGDSFGVSPGIYLKRISDNENDPTKSSAAQFARIRVGELDELATTEKTSGKYTRVYVRQNHIVLQQQSRSLSNSKLFRIRYIPAHLQHASHCLGEWNPQTRLFLSTGTVGKVGGLFFNHVGWHYIVILGLWDSGNPWIRVLPKTFQKPPEDWSFLQDWTSYPTTGREAPKSQEIIKFPKAAMTITATVSPAEEVYQTLVFNVTITRTW